MPFLFDRVAIVGVGQLGASFGMSLVAGKLAREVIGIGRSRSNLKDAVRRKAIHRIGSTRDLVGADLIVLAAPVRAIRESLRTLPRGPLVTDVGSVKGPILKEAERLRLRFVGGHPIAGTEKGGAAAGDRSLFRGRLCVVTPGRSVRASDVRSVEALWRKLGAKPVRMTAAAHDRLFAVTSHLPHALAFGLSRLAGRRLGRAAKPFVFDSFKGATRVALSPVEMWRDIFLENRTEVVSALDAMIAELKTLRALASPKNRNAFAAFLERARKNRMDLS